MNRVLAHPTLAPALLLLALIALWELCVAIFNVPDFILPAPSAVAVALWEVRDVLPGHIATTLGEALGGLTLAIFVAVPVAALVAMFAGFRRAVQPLLVASQNVPMIVLAPLLVVWFGFGITPKLIVVALIGFFPIAVATADGLVAANRDMVDLVRAMGASRLTVLRTVLIPSAVPQFFAGLKIAASYAVLAAVIGEWVGASSGLGLFIIRAQTAYRVDRVLASVVVIAVISIALFLIVQFIARRAMPYRFLDNKENTT